jgi:hypothetical protein
MADKKISALTALTAANVAPATDVVPIVDTSATETKKVTAKDLVDGALNGGTANGVLYLNGSKAATSGTALVFDGTNLGIGTSSPASLLEVRGTFGTATTAATISNGSASSASNIARLDFRLVNTFGGLERSAAIWGLNPNAAGNNGGALVFGVSANGTATTPSEVARFDQAGNLGIGTSSPTRKLFVNGFSNLGGSTNSVLVGDGTFAAGTASITADSGAALQIGTAGANEMSLFQNNTAIVRLIGGNLGMRTNSFGTSSNGVIGIANAVTVPTGNPTGGGVLYVESGALKYRGSSGTVTTIANA